VTRQPAPGCGRRSIDQGLEPGLNTGERAELAKAGRRIHQLESELAAISWAMELVLEVATQAFRCAAVTSMAAEGVRSRRRLPRARRVDAWIPVVVTPHHLGCCDDH
jgi:hypothetical protein